MTDTDFRLLHEKLDKFEQKLKELEVEVRALKPKYEEPTMESIQKKWDEITNPNYIVGKIPCMWETLPDDLKNKPLGLVCRCPKCSPYSVGGSLQSTLTSVWMNPRTTIDAVGSDSCKITKERKDET